MTKLRVIPEQGEPFDHELTGDRIVVGRSSQADLVIADGYLSRKHSEIYLEEGRLMVCDLGSRNGTLVNGRRIDRPTPVTAGDEIQLSASKIRINADELSPPPAAPAADSFEGTVFLPAGDLLERYVAPGGATGDDAEPLRQAERLAILNEIHRALATSIERDELLELILDRAFDHLKPQQGSVFLENAAGGWERVASRKTASGDEHLYSKTLIHEVVEKGMAALVLDARTDRRFDEAESILSSGVRSLIAAPLLCPDGPLGMIALNSTLSVRQFNEGDLELLSSLASIAALRIWSLALAEEAAERRRMEAELELARRIQTSLLPEALPTVPGYDLSALNFPSRGVSGDLYQILTRSDGAECVTFLADVSGKGMAASLLTATLEALAAAPIREGLPPDRIFTMLSQLLEQRTPPEKFATAFLAVLEPATGGLTYANAGHNPAIIVRRTGEVEELERTGLPLGLMPDATYGKERIDLGPEDALLVYTDGITEAADPADEEYGLERLAAVCRNHRGDSLADLLAAVEDDLKTFMAGAPYPDDRTMVALRRRSD